MKELRVLLYHRVCELSEDVSMLAVTPGNFEEHIKYISENYDVLRLCDNFDKWRQNGNRDGIIITFDDCYYDWYENALPVLEKYHVPATMFVTTGCIDTNREMWTESLHRALLGGKKYHDSFKLETPWFSGEWKTDSYQRRYELYVILRKVFQIASNDERKIFEKELLSWAGLDENGRDNRRALSTEQILELSKNELIDIGAHTVTHASLRWQNRETQYEEINESKRSLEKITGKPVDLFSYPFGTASDYSDETIEILKEAKFSKSVVGYPGDVTKKTDDFLIPRFTIRNYDKDNFIGYLEKKIFNKNFNGGGLIETKSETNKKPIEYVGKLIDDLIIQDAVCDKIIVWGTGDYGRDVYRQLVGMGLGNRVIAFADNNPNSVGKKIYDIPVISAKEAIEKRATYVVKNSYDWEICNQLMDAGVNRIHWIIE